MPSSISWKAICWTGKGSLEYWRGNGDGPGTSSGLSGVTEVMAEEKHFVTAGGSDVGDHAPARGRESNRGWLHRRDWDIDAGEFAGAVKAGKLIGIAAVGLDAVAGLARDLGRGDENANIAVPVQAAGEGKPMRTGFVTTAQFGAWMRGLELGEEFEHVVMGAADDPVTADLDRIRWCQTDGDGIGVNIKTGEQDGGVGWAPAGVPGRRWWWSR